MKEYQYSIILRESRSPKRHRNTTTVSQSDLDALRQELTDGSRGAIDSIHTIDRNLTKVDQEIKGLKSTYKVTVTTQGEIRNGEIIGGTTYDSKPAILHTAHVYGILGNKITDTTIINKLKWTVNSGRTTSPVQRFETGATCYVTADDFVRVLHTQGSNPQFYDVELNSNF